MREETYSFNTNKGWVTARLSDGKVTAAGGDLHVVMGDQQVVIKDGETVQVTWNSSPTMELRWLDGKLQQKWSLSIYAMGMGSNMFGHSEWRDVPNATGTEPRSP